MGNYQPKEKIESHSSLLTNRGIMEEKFSIDQIAIAASNSLHFNHIQAFYNAVEIWYIGIKDILAEREQLENYRREYSGLMHLLELYPKQFRNKKVLMRMLQVTKQFYSDTISGLQQYEYFFRIGQRNIKGLGNIQFFKDSIFSTRGKKENGQGEDAGEEA